MKIINLNVVKILLYLLNLGSFFWSAHSFIHNYIHPIDSCGNMIVLIGFGGLNTGFIIIGAFLHWFIQLIHSLGITFLLTISITTYIENSRNCLESNLSSVWYNFNYNTAVNIIVILYYIIFGIYSIGKISKSKYNSLDNFDIKVKNKMEQNEKKNDNLYEDDEVFINSEINIAIQKQNNNNVKGKEYNLVLDSDDEIEKNKKKHQLRYCNL